MKLSYKEIGETAKAFQNSGQEMKRIILQLDKRMNELQKSWGEMQDQDFFQTYKEWSDQTQGLAQMLNSISHDMEAIVKRYNRINK